MGVSKKRDYNARPRIITPIIIISIVLYRLMGKLENENKKTIRATKIQKIVLKTIAAAGFLSVALLAPNALRMLNVFNINNKNSRHSINNSRRRLVKNGFVEYSKEGLLKLTPSGKKVLNKFENRDFKINKPKRWDKKWRILIFDIKENNKNTRDSIRRTLISIGFVKLQKSVWVYPYDCEDLVNLLKADFDIGREVLYIIADKIENEKVLLDNFKLK